MIRKLQKMLFACERVIDSVSDFRVTTEDKRLSSADGLGGPKWRPLPPKPKKKKKKHQDRDLPPSDGEPRQRTKKKEKSTFGGFALWNPEAAKTLDSQGES